LFSMFASFPETFTKPKKDTHHRCTIQRFQCPSFSTVIPLIPALRLCYSQVSFIILKPEANTLLRLCQYLK
jgi:hypothetical protein